MQKDSVAQDLSVITVTSGAFLRHLTAKLGLHCEACKYYTEGLGYHAPPSLMIHCTDDGFVPFVARKTVVLEEYVKNMRAAGLVAPDFSTTTVAIITPS